MKSYVYTPIGDDGSDKQKDLVPYIGNKSKVSEVINGKIGLSLSMISKLSAGLHLPLEVLIQPLETSSSNKV